MGGYFDSSACLRIPSDAGFSLGYRESPEAHNRNSLPLFQRRGDASNQGIEGSFRLRSSKTCVLGYFPYEITLVQRAPLSAPVLLGF